MVKGSLFPLTWEGHQDVCADGDGPVGRAEVIQERRPCWAMACRRSWGAECSARHGLRWRPREDRQLPPEALGGGIGELGAAGTWGIVQGAHSGSFIFSVAWIRSRGRGGERPWPEVYGERRPPRPEGVDRRQ